MSKLKTVLEWENRVYRVQKIVIVNEYDNGEEEEFDIDWPIHEEFVETIDSGFIKEEEASEHDIKLLRQSVDFDSITSTYLTSRGLDTREYTVVIWPVSQEFMEESWFSIEAKLINDDAGLALFGSSAYIIPRSRIEVKHKKEEK